MNLSLNYANGNANLLTASATLTEAEIDNKTLLQSKYSNWAGPYFEPLKKRICRRLFPPPRDR